MMRPPRLVFGLLILMNIGLAILGGRWSWLNFFATGLLTGLLIAMEITHHQDKRR